MTRLSTNLDLAAGSAVAVAALALAALGEENTIAWMVIGIPLVLLLPGYALVTATFTAHRPGAAEQLLFSLGLSFIISILGGLFLNALPGGLQRTTWVSLLSGIVLVASAIALVRRHFEAGDQPGLWPFTLRLSRYKLLSLSAAAVLALAAGASASLARSPSEPDGIAGYTLLWIVPAEEGRSDGLRIGVNSWELSTVDYRLRVELDGALLYEWPVLHVPSGETWEQTLEIPANRADHGAVQAFLYRADEPGVIYRRVRLWLAEK